MTVSQQATVPLTIFTVINEAYMELGLAWALNTRANAGVDPTFVCSDVGSYEFLAGHGLICSPKFSDQFRSTTSKDRYPESSFPNDDASYTVSNKLSSALSYLQKGHAVIYSDVDAIWIKNPISEIIKLESDIAFQPGSFPAEAKAAWGFSACTGFFYLRPSCVTIELVKKSILGFDGSDQRSMNRSLMNDFEITWDSRPENWEHGRIEGGWTKAVFGKCARTGLVLAALPHSYYQRHGAKLETSNHACIFHPNSPKDMAKKFIVLRNLGIKI